MVDQPASDAAPAALDEDTDRVDPIDATRTGTATGAETAAARGTAAVTATGTAVAVRGGRRRVWAAGIAAAFVAVVVGLLALPGGKVVGDTTTNIRISSVIPGMTTGVPIIQPLVASEDRLASIYVTFGTYGGSTTCDIDVTLVERADGAEPGVGQEVATRAWPCSALPDTGRFEVLEFDPQEGSAGRTYDLVLVRTDDEPNQGVAVWTGTPKGDALPVIVDGVEQQDLSAAVRGEYDPQPHQWDHVGRSLERLAAYGPVWGATGVFVGLLVLVGLLLAAGPLALRSTRGVVVLVAALALVRGLLWSAAIPQLEAMDEPAHFAYVQFLAEEHAFPGHVDNHEIFSERLDGAIAELNVEATTPGDRPDYRADADDDVTQSLSELSPEGGGGGPGSMYAPFYYLPGAVLYGLAGDDLLVQVSVVRLWSVLMGVGAAILLVLIGRRLFPASSVAQWSFVVAGVMQPMIAHQFAIVNNDAWVITSGFAALLVGLELARRGRAPWLALLAGVVLGAALLGKPFAVATVVPLGLGWLIGKVRARQRSVRVLAGEIGLVLLGLLGTYGAWTFAAARMSLATSEVPAETGTGQTVRGFLAANFGGDLSSFRTMWADQLWGDFGWVRIPLPPPVPTVIFAVEVLLGVALAVWAVAAITDVVRARRRPSVDVAAAGGPASARADLATVPLPVDVRLLLVTSMIVAVVGTLYAAGWVYYSATAKNDLLQGRYALMAVPAILAAPGLLVERFSRGRVDATWPNVVLAVGMVAANLIGVLVVLEAFYG